jgi:hypothetical protein
MKLILQPPYMVKADDADYAQKKLVEQLESNVVLIPIEYRGAVILEKDERVMMLMGRGAFISGVTTSVGDEEDEW